MRQFTMTVMALAAFGAMTSTAQAARAEVHIVAVGDSSFLTVGVPPNQTYLAQLEAALRARGHHVTVTNQSVSGDTATGVLQRLDSAVPPGTDLVILKIGEHELKFYHASPDDVAANRRTIVERLHAKGVEVYRVQDPAGLVTSERGLTNAIAAHLIVEPNCSATVACHATAAGLAIAVRRTLPAIEALVRKVEKPGACRPQCASGQAETPSRGTKESLVRFIHSMQRGRPNYNEMGPELATANRSQISWSGPMMKSWGPLRSITFRTVNAQGMSVYDATFEKARVEFEIAPLTSDGKVTGRAWHLETPSPGL